jgi:Spy/CpxP family protein refolding chaperone
MNTDENNVSAQPEETKGATQKGSWSRKLVIGGVAAVVLAGAGAAAIAGGFDGFGRHGMMGGRFMHGFMEYRVDQALTDIGASAEQKDKIKALVKSTIDEVRPERGWRMETRDEMIKILEAPTIDRNAIEALRAKRIADIDARSKTIAKAVGDAAEVLTQDQRKKLIEEMADFGPGGPGRWQ